MEKEKLRELIHKTTDEEVLEALWELYDRQYCSFISDHNTTSIAPLIYYQQEVLR